ncbi:hypothetical protein PGTUg99_017101 [Puccinia graminis f. sp. tritici]|uniref:Uncharacterized protein n=1 Tax=Puccinia graminis f. sp. tritici TaxID=56615 RepID=A0A5B0RWM8_PUCGR|nr:hypothetical protein PGTUg99_017101 [Puccinia graminis f. sp. tritici]
MIKGPRAESFQLEVPSLRLTPPQPRAENDSARGRARRVTSSRDLELSLFSSRSPPFALPHHDLELKTIQLESHIIKGPRAESFQLEVPSLGLSHHDLKLKTIQLEVLQSSIIPKTDLELNPSQPARGQSTGDLEVSSFQLEVDSLSLNP